MTVQSVEIPFIILYSVTVTFLVSCQSLEENLNKNHYGITDSEFIKNV